MLCAAHHGVGRPRGQGRIEGARGCDAQDERAADREGPEPAADDAGAGAEGKDPGPRVAADDGVLAGDGLDDDVRQEQQDEQSAGVLEVGQVVPDHAEQDECEAPGRGPVVRKQRADRVDVERRAEAGEGVGVGGRVVARAGQAPLHGNGERVQQQPGGKEAALAGGGEGLELALEVGVDKRRHVAQNAAAGVAQPVAGVLLAGRRLDDLAQVGGGVGRGVGDHELDHAHGARHGVGHEAEGPHLALALDLAEAAVVDAHHAGGRVDEGGKVGGAVELAALGVLAHAGGGVDGVAVEAVEGPDGADHRARQRPARDANAQPEVVAVVGVLGGDRLHLQPEPGHGLDVAARVARLLELVEGARRAGAGHDVPVADVLVLEHAAAGDGLVEGAKHRVEQGHGRLGGAQLGVRLERAEHDDAVGELLADHLVARGRVGDAADHVGRDECVEQVAVLDAGELGGLEDGELVAADPLPQGAEHRRAQPGGQLEDDAGDNGRPVEARGQREHGERKGGQEGGKHGAAGLHAADAGQEVPEDEADVDGARQDRRVT